MVCCYILPSIISITHQAALILHNLQTRSGFSDLGSFLAVNGRVCGGYGIGCTALESDLGLKRFGFEANP